VSEDLVASIFREKCFVDAVKRLVEMSNFVMVSSIFITVRDSLAVSWSREVHYINCLRFFF